MDAIYLIERPFVFGECDVFGVKLKDLLGYTLGEKAKTVEKEEEAVTQDGIICLLYNDTPLVTEKEIKNLKESVLRGEAAGYRIGSGYVKKAGTDNSYLMEPPFKVLKVFNSESFTSVLQAKRYEIIDKHVEAGVIIHDPMNVHIDINVTIGKGTVIYPFNALRGNTKIGENVIVFSYNDLTDTSVGDGTDIRAVFAVSAKIGKKCTMGPFAVLRKGAIVGNACRVGDFVEIKNSTLEDDVKAAHLAYVGDSYVGANTNVGCGVVFANYDGKVKRSVIVGKDVFIGCNTNLVAPLEVQDGAYIAAGSTVTQNVPGNALCIARARQVVKNEWDRPKK